LTVKEAVEFCKVGTKYSMHNLIRDVVNYCVCNELRYGWNKCICYDHNWKPAKI